MKWLRERIRDAFNLTKKLRWESRPSGEDKVRVHFQGKSRGREGVHGGSRVFGVILLFSCNLQNLNSH